MTSHPVADISVERLARMASVDGSWWQETDRQPRRHRPRWPYALVGYLIGALIGGSGWAFALLS